MHLSKEAHAPKVSSTHASSLRRLPRGCIAHKCWRFKGISASKGCISEATDPLGHNNAAVCAQPPCPKLLLQVLASSHHLQD